VRLAELLFWGSLAIPLYAYLLYPLAIWLCSRFAKIPAAASDEGQTEWPSVTLLILAQRDEQTIVERLSNAVALDYPRGRLEILVGCVGEEDLTGLLARSFDKRQVDVRQFPKRGEAFVVNACLRQARGEIVVFSDARTLMRPDALRRLACHFRDPAVGGVSGKLVVADSATSRLLDPRAWRFESFLKRCELRVSAIPCVSRGIYAIRKNLFVPLALTNRGVDSAIASSIDRQGYRLVYDEGALATARAQSFGKPSSFLKRLRAGAVQGFGLIWPATGIWRRAVCVAFWLHALLRRLCPAFLIAAFISNACLMDDPFYLHGMLFHELVYVATLVGLFLLTASRRRWLRLSPQKRGLSTENSAGGVSGWPSGASGNGAVMEATPVCVQAGVSNRA
jgi:cellulose synthase/poly-beta-1,6-N-acetylglucosamine synthase-like glycosyltransferase